ncbi:PREDICTED: kinesin-like protein KIF17 [Gekko japonicus]|uniref:Kinesin-like protein n=1 Tax=Gekko japonicus TaxID=146911 RepID=A0ABM1KZR7_GEKJA|nr:PREDICTED: kinesin-like protein KIF17 [Gekko japonicus]
MASETVKVIVRCRPLNDREKQLRSKIVLTVDSGRRQCFIQNPAAIEDPPKQFTFDGAYYMDHTTEQIYNEIAYPLVEGVTEGYNGTIFAYGQTGSGKSFTMQGILDPPSQKGIIPRAFEHLFESVQCAENTKFLVRASYLEIYNEDIRDLLGSDAKQKLELKEHPEKGVYVKGLSLHTVHNMAQCERIMETGLKNRAVGFTLMNKDSSRSHSIFTITMEIYTVDQRGQDHLRAAKLNLVDLAGSERQSKTGAVGERLKEATKINLSLSALSNVISALADARCTHIPYRDSKLTRVLQASLGGNTKTLMVACLSPADSNYDETLSTLRYAHRAKNIQNKPCINEDPKDALLREYQEEIRKLKAILAQQSNTCPLHVEVPRLLPSEAAQHEGKPELPPEFQTNTEKEKELIREEYEEKLDRLKADYEAEQKSRVQLEGDISALRIAYDRQLTALEERKEDAGITQPVEAFPEPVPQGPASETEMPVKEFSSREPPVPGTDMPEEIPAAVDQQQVLARLQLLEQQVVGGEQAKNKALKEKHQRRKRLADERKQQLLEALQGSDEDSSDWVLLSVYDSIQEEVRAKSKLLEKMKEKLRAAEAEIRDLQSEFELEKIDYLATIRRQERELLLHQQILEQVQPLVRRDCNYRNFDKIKSESTWDEDSGCWKIPEPITEKTSLPGEETDLPLLPSGWQPGVGTDKELQEEDRYKTMLSKSDSENIASSYFRSKRASQLLSGDPVKSLASHNAPSHPPSSSTGPISPTQTAEMPQPRPFRLESLDFSVPLTKTKRKKSRHNRSGDPF